MCFHFQNIKFSVQAPLVEIELTVWQKNRARTKGWSAIHISFWFLVLVSKARNVCSFSKHQIWWSGILYMIPCKCHITFITLRFFYVKTSLEMDRTLNLNSFFENINGQVINAWAVSRSHKTCGMDEIGPIIINVKFHKGNKMFYKKLQMFAWKP